MAKPRYIVKFYADSKYYGPNFLFTFKVDDQAAALKLADKFRARVVYLQNKSTGQSIRLR